MEQLSAKVHLHLVKAKISLDMVGQLVALIRKLFDWRC